MNSLLSLLKNRYLYLSAAGLILFGGLSILALDRWIMPAYTNYNAGVTVPDVTRLSLEDAQAKLELYGFRYEILDRRAHSAFPANYITDQSPEPRQIVKPNRKIYLTVNTTERPAVVVPNVENMSIRNAQIQLENYGLEVGTISYESARFRNTVIRQSVAPGDSVDQGTVVDLVLSDGLGGDIVRVPELTGLLLPEAQNRLSEAGLRIGEIRFEPSRDVIPNTVLSYSPVEETMREGQSIDLVISERFDAREVDEAGAIIDDEEGFPEELIPVAPPDTLSDGNNDDSDNSDDHNNDDSNNSDGDDNSNGSGNAGGSNSDPKSPKYNLSDLS